MDPIVQLLQNLLTTQGASMGMNPTMISTIGSGIDMYQNSMNQENQSKGSRLNTDRLRDIEAYRVNPFKGFMAQMGGMAQGMSPELLPLTMVPFISPGLNLLPQTVQSLQTGGLITTSRLSPLMQAGGFVNTTGYTPGTPSFNNPINIIPGNNITMKNTPFPLMAIPNIGNPKLLTPGQQNVNFPGANYVTELPLMMFGGNPLAALYQMGYGGMIESYDRGGRIAKRQARLEKRQDRLEAKGKTGGQRYENIQARLDDIAAGGSGISKTGRFFEDVGNVAAKVAKAAAPIMSFIPGVGLAVGPAMAAAGSLLDQAIVTDKERGVGLSGGQQPATQNYTNPQPNYAPSQAFNPMSLFSMINPGINAGQYPFASLTTPAVPTGGMNPNVGTYNPAQNSGIYNPIQAPGLTPQTVQNLLSGMGQLQPMFGNTLPKLQIPDLTAHKKKGGTVKGKKKMILFNSPAMYQMGGEVQGINLIPIQTEKVGKIAEMIIHTDNTITPVNATKPHSRMEPDEVTDIVPEGSYIASADKSIKITYDEADEILIAVKADSYEELKKGKLPQEIKLSSLWPDGSKKPLTPAELTKLVLQKYPTVDRDDLFTKMTNQSNIDSRLPYLMQIIKLNEEKKNNSNGMVAMEAPMFKKGGKVTSKYTKSYQPGGPVPSGGFSLESLLGMLGTAVPLIGSIFGGNQGAPNGGVGSVPPWVMAGIQSTVPMYQQGVNDNIAAQQAALTSGVQDYAALANQLQGYAQQSAQGQNLGNLGAMGLGVLNALGTETTLPSMDLGALRSRVSNFRPASASRAAVDAAATPTYDATAIMQTLGSRSAPMIAQLESQRMGARNQAAQQRNLALDNAEQNRISQLNQIDQTEMAYNLGQQEKERALREGRRQLLTGTMAQGVQRSADINTGLLSQIGSIQSQTLPAMLQLQLQNAGLTGQNMMLGAQNALNAYGLYGSMASQNATANYLNQNNPIPPAAQPPEMNNTGNCPAGQIMSCGTCVSATTNDPHGCLSNQMWVDATQTCVCQ